MQEDVIITVSQREIDNVQSISSKLSEHGLKIKNIFSFGVISGVIEKNKINELKKIAGVISIEIDKNINIPPPDSQIQ